MSVYIKGLKRPNKCGACAFGIWADTEVMPFCSVSGESFCVKDFISTRPDDCPLIPVPDHGDLIERDDLISFCVRNKTDEWNKQVVTTYAKALDEFEGIVQDAPTIIPADKEDE